MVVPPADNHNIQLVHNGHVTCVLHWHSAVENSTELIWIGMDGWTHKVSLKKAIYLLIVRAYEWSIGLLPRQPLTNGYRCSTKQFKNTTAKCQW